VARCLICNGHIYPEVDGKNLGTELSQPESALLQYCRRKFANITAHAGNTLNEMHSLVAGLGDFFDNGREEALVNNMETKLFALLQHAPWALLSIQPDWCEIKPRPLGAQVTLETKWRQVPEEIRVRRFYFAKRLGRSLRVLGRPKRQKKS